MGHKKVCLFCRKACNLSPLSPKKFEVCTACGKEMILLAHRFRPPRKKDDQGWAVVEFLIENGFFFQHIYQEGAGELKKKIRENYVSYPQSMVEAREFVIRYKDKAIRR